MQRALSIASSVASAAAQNRPVMAYGASMRTFVIWSFGPMWLGAALELVVNRADAATDVALGDRAAPCRRVESCQRLPPNRGPAIAARSKNREVHRHPKSERRRGSRPAS